MTETQLARFTCRFCGKGFNDGRKLGGHVRQAHQKAIQPQSPISGEGEMAARVLEMWKEGNEPYSIITSLRVHPIFVRGVLREYDDLLNEWKKSSEATSTLIQSTERVSTRTPAEITESSKERRPP